MWLYVRNKPPFNANMEHVEILDAGVELVRVILCEFSDGKLVPQVHETLHTPVPVEMRGAAVLCVA